MSIYHVPGPVLDVQATKTDSLPLRGSRLRGKLEKRRHEEDREGWREGAVRESEEEQLEGVRRAGGCPQLERRVHPAPAPTPTPSPSKPRPFQDQGCSGAVGTKQGGRAGRRSSWASHPSTGEGLS